MALLKNKWKILPHEQHIAEQLFQRLSEIDDELKDFFISWDTTKRLLQEQTEIKDILQKLGYEP